MEQKLQEIVNKIDKVGGYSLVTITDIDYLVEQAKKLEFLKSAVIICNDEKVLPTDLAESLKKYK